MFEPVIVPDHSDKSEFYSSSGELTRYFYVSKKLYKKRLQHIVFFVAAICTAIASLTIATIGTSYALLPQPFIPTGATLIGPYNPNATIAFDVVLTDTAHNVGSQTINKDDFSKKYGNSNIDAIQNYFINGGLIAINDPDNIVIHVSGSVANIDNLLKTKINTYQLNGMDFYSNSIAPTIPENLSSYISAIVGLSNYSNYSNGEIVAAGSSINNSLATSPACPDAEIVSNNMNATTPNEIANVYGLNSAYSSNLNGQNKNIAIMELSNVDNSDFLTYEQCYGLQNTLKQQTTTTLANSQATTDAEVIAGLLPQATIDAYATNNSPVSVLNTEISIANTDIDSNIVIGFQGCDSNTDSSFLFAENEIFTQLALQGQNVFSAQNTTCAADPSSQPYVVGIGSSSLQDNNGTITENPYALSSDLGSWETKLYPIGSKIIEFRSTPEIYAAANNYLVYTDGTWGTVSNTNISSDIWASTNVLRSSSCTKPTPLFNSYLDSQPNVLGSPTANLFCNLTTPAPVVQSLGVTSGTISGGTSVSIIGSNFTGATEVLFGTIPSTNFTVISNSSIIATAPPGQNAGAVNITVQTENGVSTTSLNDQYTYTPQTLADSKTQNYNKVSISGQVIATSPGAFYGDLTNNPPASPIVSGTMTSNGGGYWLLGSDGGVFTFGNASFYGSLSGTKLSGTPIGIIASTDNNGYIIATSTGSIYVFGDAVSYGEITSAIPSTIVSIIPTFDNHGYWLISSDGGVFSFGDAGFYGSAFGNTSITSTNSIVGATPTLSGKGYWLVAANGAVFPFGDAINYGSPQQSGLGVKVAGIAASPTGSGYWMLLANGSVLNFGDAANLSNSSLISAGVGGYAAILPVPDVYVSQAGIPANYLHIYMATPKAVSIPAIPNYVPWQLLAAIGTVESNNGQSTAPGVSSGLNTAGCCGGPMQFEPTTFVAYDQPYIASLGGVVPDTLNGGALPPGDTELQDTVYTPGLYDPADAIPAAARYLQSLWDGTYSANPIKETDISAWEPFICQYGGFGSVTNDCHNGYFSEIESLVKNYSSTPIPQIDGNEVTYGNINITINATTTIENSIAYTALGQVGTPYVWGGETPSQGFDCSGLAQWVYAQAGISVPRTGQAQLDSGTLITSGALQTGDLVFFGSLPNTDAHVGIFLGYSANGTAYMIDAPNASSFVRIDAFTPILGYAWGNENYLGAIAS